MTADSSYQLDALDRQWRATKAPKLGLQLAEEHRRRGDLDAAIQILEAGLESHPEHMSSRVALSRYLVDNGGFGTALEHLLRIVGSDPVHLVANKLLVRCYLGLGRYEEAREKLDIYEMLGEGDEDIEGLRAEVKSGASPAPLDQPAAEPPEAETAFDRFLPEDETEAEPGSPETSDSLDLPDSPVEPPALLAPLAPLAPPAPVTEDEGEAFTAAAFERESPAPQPFGSSDEPFGSGWTSSDELGYWDRVGAEGIFTLDGQSPIGGTEPRKPSEAEAADEAGSLFDSEPPAEDDSEEPAPIAESEPAPESTVTLGKLYLDQGHTAAAADTFRQVLEREPENAAAREGLETLKISGLEDKSPKERKKAVLIAYRAQLRRALKGGV